VGKQLKMVSVFLERWRHFVSSKTLLCFRVRLGSVA